jgi:5-methyltetrahydropteroyltriglutamate--homocysteine methyltransferase
MAIPTEPIGSVPRPRYLLKAMSRFAAGALDQVALEAWQDQAVAETIELFEATGSPVVTEGEQAKPSFATYSLSESALAPDGVVIPFADGHTGSCPG